MRKGLRQMENCRRKTCRRTESPRNAPTNLSHADHCRDKKHWVSLLMMCSEKLLTNLSVLPKILMKCPDLKAIAITKPRESIFCDTSASASKLSVITLNNNPFGDFSGADGVMMALEEQEYGMGESSSGDYAMAFDQACASWQHRFGDFDQMLRARGIKHHQPLKVTKKDKKPNQGQLCKRIFWTRLQSIAKTWSASIFMA